MTDQIEMPKYKCHKQVSALKIQEVANVRVLGGGAYLRFEGPEHDAFHVDDDYLLKHKPEAGGYYVVYEDGYKSFSPAEAFEDGYTMISDSIAQQRVSLVLSRLEQFAGTDPDDRQAIGEEINKLCDELQGYDFFGSEGQNDPRGDFRESDCWNVLGHVQGVDK